MRAYKRLYNGGERPGREAQEQLGDSECSQTCVDLQRLSFNSWDSEAQPPHKTLGGGGTADVVF